MTPEKNLLHELREAVLDLREYIHYQRDLGEGGFPTGVFPTSSGISELHSMTLNEIKSQIKDCKRCKLHTGRKNTVFGTGNEHAKLFFVGEAPGHDEDLKGEPFVGKAGHLLTRIIKAIDLNRKDIYIANIIKCRPPNNRNPKPDEIASCKPFLIKQIQGIQPKIICALGTFAAQTLLGTSQSISKLRGEFHDFHGIKLLPTYHPAFLLRNPSFKRQVWEDMQMIQKEYFTLI